MNYILTQEELDALKTKPENVQKFQNDLASWYGRRFSEFRNAVVQFFLLLLSDFQSRVDILLVCNKSDEKLKFEDY